MNIYDTKQLHCRKCGVFIGEISYDAEVTMPTCGRCANPMPEGDDKAMYTASKYSQPKEELIPV